MSKAKSDKVSPDLDTPTDLPRAAVDKISASLNTLLADAFALYLKTKNFHWHVSGRHFRDYHLMLDEQSDAIFATTDQLAERVRKLGGTTMRSIGQIAKLQTIKDNNERLCPAARNAARTDGRQQARGRRHAQGAQACRRVTRIPAPPDCSRPSSTRPSAAPGSCSKPAARKAATRSELRRSVKLRTPPAVIASHRGRAHARRWWLRQAMHGRRRDHCQSITYDFHNLISGSVFAPSPDRSSEASPSGSISAPPDNSRRSDA